MLDGRCLYNSRQYTGRKYNWQYSQGQVVRPSSFIVLTATKGGNATYLKDKNTFFQIHVRNVYYSSLNVFFYKQKFNLGRGS